MPVIVLKEGKRQVLDLEPYFTFNKRFEDQGDDLDGAVIHIELGNYGKGFGDGFSIDEFYGNNISLKFFLSEIGKGNSEQQEHLIRHTLEYDFNCAFLKIQQDSLSELEQRARYFYVPEVQYFEFSYHLFEGHAKLCFDVSVRKNDIQKVCNQLISQDIAIFSRGW